jgi:hypothetical protein
LKKKKKKKKKTKKKEEEKEEEEEAKKNKKNKNKNTKKDILQPVIPTSSASTQEEPRILQKLTVTQLGKNAPSHLA